jgi:O-antigen ligase
MATPAQTAGYPPLFGELERPLRLSWVGLITTIAVVVMFIPIRRYSLPGNLPFELEPYRLLVAVIVAGWIVALLVDPEVRLRPTGLRAPLFLLLGGVFGSIAVNHATVAGNQTQVIKSLTFLLSFLVLLVLIVSVVHTREAVDRLLAVLVGSGSVVAAFAILESRTGFNAFNDLHKIAPFLTLDELPETPGRGARLRVLASAQHPIALSAAMVMLAPLGGYLAVRRRRRTWWVATVLLLVAAVATLSRTGVLMVLVLLIVFAVLRPREARRLLPIAIPLLLAVHLSLPGALGSLKSAFAPQGGLVNEQEAEAGKAGSGRIADLGPSIEQFKHNPLLGEGFGTRVVDNGQVKAKVLDNQWLGTLLETGLIGVLGWLWLLGRTVRRLGRHARGDPSDRGLLMAALAGSIAAFAVGMFTYDAFSFIQVTYLMFILVALSVVLLREGQPAARKGSPWR